MTGPITAELTKIRSVRSSAWTLALTFALGVGLSFLAASSFRASLPDMDAERKASFGPLFATFYSLTLAQLALVVFGVLVMSAEYGSGTIRSSLVAMPRRGRLYGAKVSAGALVLCAVSAVTVVVTFFTAQVALGPYSVTLGGDGVPGAIVGAWLYLTLIGLFALGVAAMLRSSMGSLAILLPILFLGSQGIGNVPKLKPFAQYLPDQAGSLIMHIVPLGNDPRFSRDYGPWTGVGILAVWAAAALIGGYLTLRRRDA